MAYFLDLFTPETWASFQEHGATVSGFRERRRRMARERVNSGDTFICYLVRLSRWCGVLKIVSEAYRDDTPIYSNPDPFVIRFKVEPTVLLEPEFSIPIFEDEVWDALSETKSIKKGAPGWAMLYRSSLRQIDDADGKLLASLLQRQQSEKRRFPLTDRDKRQLARRLTVRTLDREVEVEVPDDDEDEVTAETTKVEPAPPIESRQSIQMQAKVARIGVEMGFNIWVPRSDKGRVLEHVPEDMHKEFLDVLPLNYDDKTLRTIAQIDVLWLKGRSMARAFEIEHTTVVYSGLLRMADLLALQPNMDIRLHIVAPEDKRDKVLREIKRPVFSLLERGPLYEKCTFLTYEAINSLAETPHLAHMSDSIIDDFEELAEDY